MSICKQLLSAVPSRAVPGSSLLDNLAGQCGVLDMPQQRPEAEDDATILYTSGSTGHPKVLCHKNILAALMSWELDQASAIAMLPEAPPPPTHQVATLLAVPLFHATSSRLVYLASYRSQRKIVSVSQMGCSNCTSDRSRKNQFLYRPGSDDRRLGTRGSADSARPEHPRLGGRWRRTPVHRSKSETLKRRSTTPCPAPAGV